MTAHEAVIVVLGPLLAPLSAVHAFGGSGHGSGLSGPERGSESVTSVPSIECMDELHRATDKFFTEVDHLDAILSDETLDPAKIALALSQSKRVRRESNLVVRALARLRDQLQP